MTNISRPPRGYKVPVTVYVTGEEQRKLEAVRLCMNEELGDQTTSNVLKMLIVEKYREYLSRPEFVDIITKIEI